MKDSLKEQFKSLQTIILDNVKTIRGLVAQSDSLSEIIKKLGDSPENLEIKSSLELTREDISKSIGELIKHTEKLFKVYDQLLDDCFRK